MFYNIMHLIVLSKYWLPMERSQYYISMGHDIQRYHVIYSKKNGRHKLEACLLDKWYELSVYFVSLKF